MFRLRLRIPVVLMATVLTLIQCKAVPLTAPGGASFTITANPTSIPSVGGTSTITIVMFKAAEDGGGTVADGTQIFLTTDLGIIEERVATTIGIARATLQSNGRAGTATITATSGTATGASGGEGQSAGTVSVEVGAGITIRLTANPPTVSPPGLTSEIIATVFDSTDNRVPGVPIIFTITAGGGALASQGASLRTNASGQAFDRLTLLNEDTASVTAFSGAVASDPVTVSRGTVAAPLVTSISPTSGAPGDTLAVTITGLNFQPGAVASFGQGIAVNSVTFVNSRTLRANITIDQNAQITTVGRTVTVTNADGGSGSLSDAFLVTTPGAAPPPFISSISPTSSGTRSIPLDVTITGTDFQTDATVGFSPGGIVINSVTVSSSTQIIVNITVDPSTVAVPTGTQFDITVINGDGGQATRTNAFTVTS